MPAAYQGTLFRSGGSPLLDLATPEGIGETTQRNSLDLLARFIHLQIDEKRDERGRKAKRETMIFPRYHQLDVVRKLLADARQRGAGKRYLIQHSAGSGKSMSIAWLALT